MSARYALKNCSDKELLTGVKVLVGQEREATAQLIAHLAEIDERRLYLAEGCSSLFKYCTEVLHLSEPSAYNRIDVARVARKFPVIFEKLAEGAIHLSAIRILGPCLTQENHLALLESATHKSKEEVERIAVAVRPHPDVPSLVRKLPERIESPSAERSEVGLFGANSVEANSEESSRVPAESAVIHDPAQPTSIPVVSVQRRPAVSALSPGRYKIEFTADEETYQALRKLQGLLAHQVPKGDPPTIFKKALLLLLEEVRREKLAEVKRPRKSSTSEAELWGKTDISAPEEKQPSRESRHIPADVKRAVWKRDQGRCAFVGRKGRRCAEDRRLEFHHIHAYALGGPPTIDNIALRCRAHNMHESRVLFGGNGKKLARSEEFERFTRGWPNQRGAAGTVISSPTPAPVLGDLRSSLTPGS